MAAFLVELPSTRSFSDPRPLSPCGSASSRFFESSSITQLVREQDCSGRFLWVRHLQDHFCPLTTGQNSVMEPYFHVREATKQSWVVCPEGKEMSFGRCIHHYAIASKWKTWDLNPGSLGPKTDSTAACSTSSPWTVAQSLRKCGGLHQFFSVFFPPITVGGCLVAVLRNSVKVAIFRKQQPWEQILSVCSVPDMALCMLHVLLYLIVTITQEIGNYYWSHFPGKEAGYVSKAT